MAPPGGRIALSLASSAHECASGPWPILVVMIGYGKGRGVEAGALGRIQAWIWRPRG
jgi:hypothetical protein